MAKGNRGGKRKQSEKGASKRISDLQKKIDANIKTMDGIADKQWKKHHDQEMPPKWYKLLRENQDMQTKIREIRSEQDRKYRQSKEYKNAVKRIKNERADKEHVRQREREITSSTYNRAVRRKEKDALRRVFGNEAIKGLR